MLIVLCWQRALLMLKMDGLVKNMLLVTFLLGIYWNCCESYTLDNNTLIRSRRQTQGQACKGDNTKFQCATTADCISSDLECDGKQHCPDGSDESKSLCTKYPCPKVLFRCDYGACVNSDGRCNGIKDCNDNSDEKNCEVKITNITNDSENCTTPAHPEHGQWIYVINDRKGEPNRKVDTQSVISFSCELGYQLSTTYDDSLTASCLSTGKWSVTAIPSCQKICPIRYNSPSITISCKNDGTNVPCHKASDNTIMTYKCAPYHEPVNERVRSSVCHDGLWDQEINCIPVCGKKRVSATPLIINGKEVEKGHYPWTLALFSNKDTVTFFENICGASLLTTQIALTAANCVTKKKTGAAHKVKHFRVGAGKYYKGYDDPRDRDTVQYSEVDLIEVHREYKGEVQNFRGDIALLKLKIHLVLSKVVQPVCINNLPRLEESAHGELTGWGHTTSFNQPPESVKELDVVYIEDEKCLTILDTDYANRYLTTDKLCTELSDTRMCPRHDGSGLVFRNPNHKNRYFIHGILSLSQSDPRRVCYVDKIGLFTKVETYIEWIQQKVRQWDSSKPNLRTFFV